MPSLKSIPSFYASILFQARATPHATAVVLETRQYSYREFARDIERVTRRLHRLGWVQGSRVGVSIAEPYLRWVVTASLARMGMLSISLGGFPREIAFVRARHVIGDAPREAEGEGYDSIQADAGWLSEEADAWPAFEDKRFTRGTPCRMVLSSGTTGLPKKVLLTYGDIVDRIVGNARVYGLNATARLLTTMGPTTVGGFMMYVSAWSGGGTALLINDPPTSDLMRLLALQPNVLFSSPAQLAAMMQTLPADYWPSIHLYMYVAGGILPAALSRAVRTRLTQSLFNIYGSTEAGSVSLAHTLRAENEPGFTGFVLAWAHVEVVGEDGQVLPPGEAGELRLRSHGMAVRYEDEPENTDAAFRDGWFYPGDLGRLTPDGGLVVMGRTREVMNLGGSKIAPEVIEEAVAQCPGMTDHAAFALGPQDRQRPWVAVVAADGFDDAAVRKRFAQMFPRLPGLGVARVRDIPRNAMGKVMRVELASHVQKAIDQSSAQARPPGAPVSP